MTLYPYSFQVSQERLIELVSETLIDSKSDVDSKIHQKKVSDAIDRLPCLADGINVDVKFRRIDDFEVTPELDIFRLLSIPLYHGWIVDPQDMETSVAIGYKSYNDVMAGLVALETQTVRARSIQSSGECSVDFSAVVIASLGVPVPSQQCSKTRSFAEKQPASAEHRGVRKEDIEDNILLLRNLGLSERKVLGFDTHSDSSSDENQMSEDATLVTSMECVASSSLCQECKSDDQFSSTDSEDKTYCDVGNEGSGALDYDQLSSTELGESDGISEILLKSDCTRTLGFSISQHSKSDDQYSSTDCDVENKINVGENVHSTSSVTKSSEALHHDQLSSMEMGDENVETGNNNKMASALVTSCEAISEEKTNLQSNENDSISEILLKSEAETFAKPDTSGRSQDEDHGDKCESSGSPAYEGESLLGKSSSEERDDTNGLTLEKGEVIRSFLDRNASQLTFSGLFCLLEGLKEGELCVFFRNNHFSTMLKYENELYLLVTDQGYLTHRDLVWEKLNQVNGDSVFMTGDFKVFKSDSSKCRKWNRQNAVGETADYICSINSSSKEGMEIDPDLKMAMELQKEELGGVNDRDDDFNPYNVW